MICREHLQGAYQNRIRAAQCGASGELPPYLATYFIEPCVYYAWNYFYHYQILFPAGGMMEMQQRRSERSGS